MSKNKRYKVTISHVTYMSAENEEEAKQKALDMFEISGPRLYSSIECEPTNPEDEVTVVEEKL